MSNLKGGRKVLTAAFTALSTLDEGLKTINVRNYDGNSDMEFSNASDGERIGWLNGSEAHAFHSMRPKDIFVKGAAGDVVYWNGNG